MTKSQIISAIATTAAVVAAVAAKLVPLADILPPAVARWLPVVVVIAGAVTTAFNQSLSPGHVSIPVAEAKALGVAPEQTGE